MAKSSRRKFLQQGALGVAAVGVGGATGLRSEAAPDKNSVSQNRVPTGSTTGFITMNEAFLEDFLVRLLWRTTREDPTFYNKGLEAGSTNRYFIEVLGPVSDEELDRTSATITMVYLSGPEQPIATGTTLYPFDGSVIHIGNLAGGDYVFRAKATYADGTEISSSPGLVVRLSAGRDR